MLLFLTVLQIVSYKLAGMNVFDAICNSFSTIAAGGFSPNPDSIMGYNSSLIIWITILFMFLSGANFALQYKVYVQRKFNSLIKSDEFKLYLALFLGISFFISLMLILEGNYPCIIAIRDAMFETISTMTSTGFASVDYTKWVLPAKIFLFLAMFIGGCAGSAAGGVKVVRLLYMFKFLKTEIVKILHPNAVVPIKIDKNIVQDEVGKQIVSFVMFYFLIFAVFAFIVALIENNLVIGLTGSISAIGNIGPAFGALGPYETFAVLHPATKVIFIIMMLVGRLELIPFLAMFHIDFWKIRQ